MLDETKKMLLLNEKMYECQHPGCGRRFATPGNLRDHLNEHRYNAGMHHHTSVKPSYAIIMHECG
jgi:hypothetical protein